MTEISSAAGSPNRSCDQRGGCKIKSVKSLFIFILFTFSILSAMIGAVSVQGFSHGTFSAIWSMIQVFF